YRFGQGKKKPSCGSLLTRSLWEPCEPSEISCLRPLHRSNYRVETILIAFERRNTMLKLVVSSLILIAFGAVNDEPYGDLGDLKIAKPEDKMDVTSAPAPEGALVLFDGKSLDNWTKTDGKTPASWTILDGGIMQVKGGNIITKQKFDGHFKLHVEFRVPYMPKAKGQARGNSGVYVQGRYEVQILDSYGLESKHDDCGAIYEVAAPKVNACKAPTVWQSYDIEFHSP